MCGLRWADVGWADVGWDTGEIIVRRRVSRAESAPVLVDLTKTHKTRTVPVDQGTLEALRRFHASLVERAELCGVSLHRDAHLFSSSADGTVFWQPASVSRRFRTILHRHGLEHVTLYSLRHQAATVMIDAGIDAKTVSERLGNSVTTVLTTYTRARTAADRAAADLMGSIYDP
ncbi:MAG: tyrosine-type recombinase/integrase [Acidimicrobiales bacterium]